MNLSCVTDCIVPGAGAFEVAAHAALIKHKETVKGRARLGKSILIQQYGKLF